MQEPYLRPCLVRDERLSGYRERSCALGEEDGVKPLTRRQEADLRRARHAAGRCDGVGPSIVHMGKRCMRVPMFLQVTELKCLCGSLAAAFTSFVNSSIGRTSLRTTHSRATMTQNR